MQTRACHRQGGEEPTGGHSPHVSPPVLLGGHGARPAWVGSRRRREERRRPGWKGLGKVVWFWHSQTWSDRRHLTRGTASRGAETGPAEVLWVLWDPPCCEPSSHPPRLGTGRCPAAPPRSRWALRALWCVRLSSAVPTSLLEVRNPTVEQRIGRPWTA